MNTAPSQRPSGSMGLWRLLRQSVVLLWMFLVVYHPGAAFVYATRVVMLPADTVWTTTRWIGATYPHAECPIDLAIAPLLSPRTKSPSWVGEVLQVCGAPLSSPNVGPAIPPLHIFR